MRFRSGLNHRNRLFRTGAGAAAALAARPQSRLAILLATREALATHHIARFHEADGNDETFSVILRLVASLNQARLTGQGGHDQAIAVVESFFSSLKKERIKNRVYKTRELARADVFDYIEVFYNRNRRHSHLGGVSPEAFEQASF
jgi:hypothetical protein